jgi:hypothetical protein
MLDLLWALLYGLRVAIRPRSKEPAMNCLSDKRKCSRPVKRVDACRLCYYIGLMSIETHESGADKKYAYYCVPFCDHPELHKITVAGQTVLTSGLMSCKDEREFRQVYQNCVKGEREVVYLLNGKISKPM